MTMGPIIRTGPEFTKVGMETEVKIPFRTWLVCIFVSAVDVLSVVSILVLSSLQVWNWQHPPRVHGSGWWPPVARALVIWWPSAVILMLVGVIAWSVPLLYRFLAETVVKQFPQYTQYPAERGRWRPFKPQRYDEEEFDQEAETPPYKVEGRIQKGKNQILYLEFELEGYDAALKWHKFCKAVANKGRNFSYNEAVKRHHLSPADWGRIYNTFILQECVKPTGQRGTPELLGAGMDWVRLYADTPPPSPA